MKTLNSLSKFDFFKWVFEQHPEKTIDHQSWCNCAFGVWVGLELDIPDHKAESIKPNKLNDVNFGGGEYDEKYDCPVLQRLNIADSGTIPDYEALQAVITRYYPDWVEGAENEKITPL